MMGRPTKITNLAVRDVTTRSAQFAAFTEALSARRHYAFSHLKTYLRVAPNGDLHLCVLGATETPEQHPFLSDQKLTALFAEVPFQCDPSAVAKAPGRMNALLDQLHTAFLIGVEGELQLVWGEPRTTKLPLWLERMRADTQRALERKQDEWPVFDLQLVRVMTAKDLHVRSDSVAQPPLPAVRLETGLNA